MDINKVSKAKKAKTTKTKNATHLARKADEEYRRTLRKREKDERTRLRKLGRLPQRGYSGGAAAHGPANSREGRGGDPTLIIPPTLNNAAKAKVEKNMGNAEKLLRKTLRGLAPLVLGSNGGHVVDLALGVYDALGDLSLVDHGFFATAPLGKCPDYDQFRQILVKRMFEWHNQVSARNPGSGGSPLPKQFDLKGVGPESLFELLYSAYKKAFKGAREEEQTNPPRAAWEAVKRLLKDLTETFRSASTAEQIFHNDFGLPYDETQPYGGPRVPSSRRFDQHPYAPSSGGLYDEDTAWRAHHEAARAKAYNTTPQDHSSHHPAAPPTPSSGAAKPAPRQFGKMNPPSSLIKGQGGGPAVVAYNESGAIRPMHPSIIERIETDYGPGIRVTGRQIMCVVGNSDTTQDSGAGCLRGAGTSAPVAQVIDASDNNIVLAQGTGVIPGNAIKLTPDYLNLRIGILAQMFSRWRWNDGHVIYTPTTTTSTTGAFVMAHSEDSAYGKTVGAPTFDGVTQVEGAQMTQYWVENQLHIPGGEQDEFLFTESIPGSYPGTEVKENSDRMCCHGMILAMPSADIPFSASGTEYGIMWICYDITLADPMPSLGLATAYTLQHTIGEKYMYCVQRYLLANPALTLRILRDSGVIVDDLSSSEDKEIIRVLTDIGLYSPTGNPLSRLIGGD